MSDKEKTGVSPAVATARMARGEDKVEVTILSTGIRARLVPVATALLDDVRSKVADPKVPMWFNKEKEREEPNYSDPGYRNALEEAADKRSHAVMDLLIMLGTELVDGVPDDGWEKRLLWLQKRGVLDLSEYDLEDSLEREFVYKRHIALAATDYRNLMAMCGVTQAEVDRQAATFQGDETGTAD